MRRSTRGPGSDAQSARADGMPHGAGDSAGRARGAREERGQGPTEEHGGEELCTMLRQVPLRVSCRMHDEM